MLSLLRFCLIPQPNGSIYSVATAPLAHSATHTVINCPRAIAPLLIRPGTVIAPPTIGKGVYTVFASLFPFLFAVFVVTTTQARSNSSAQMDKEVPKALMTSLRMVPPFRRSGGDFRRKIDARTAGP